jgi:hypothetical protein
MTSGSSRTIRSLAPSVTQIEAVAAFEGRMRRLFGAPLRSVAAAYVPFRLYEVEITNRGRCSTTLFAADAVNGSLDLYEFERPPADAELVSVESRNSPPAQLEETLSLRLVEEKVRRAVFQAGFFRVSGLSVSARRLPIDIHVPYWLGFFGNEGRARVRVMNAVRRQMEGAKARALFEDWLREE